MIFPVTWALLIVTSSREVPLFCWFGEKGTPLLAERQMGGAQPALDTHPNVPTCMYAWGSGGRGAGGTRRPSGERRAQPRCDVEHDRGKYRLTPANSYRFVEYWWIPDVLRQDGIYAGIERT